MLHDGLIDVAICLEACPSVFLSPAVATMARSDEEVHRHLVEAMRGKGSGPGTLVQVIFGSDDVERVNQQYIDANRDLVYAIHTITAMHIPTTAQIAKAILVTHPDVRLKGAALKTWARDEAERVHLMLSYSKRLSCRKGQSRSKLVQDLKKLRKLLKLDPQEDDGAATEAPSTGTHCNTASALDSLPDFPSSSDASDDDDDPAGAAPLTSSALMPATASASDGSDRAGAAVLDRLPDFPASDHDSDGGVISDCSERDPTITQSLACATSPGEQRIAQLHKDNLVCRWNELCRDISKKESPDLDVISLGSYAGSDGCDWKALPAPMHMRETIAACESIPSVPEPQKVRKRPAAAGGTPKSKKIKSAPTSKSDEERRIWMAHKHEREGDVFQIREAKVVGGKPSSRALMQAAVGETRKTFPTIEQAREACTELLAMFKSSVPGGDRAAQA